MATATLIQDDQSLESVASEYGTPIRTYDDGYGPLYVYRTSLGVTGIVRAQTWHDAYDCVLDDILTPIDASEIPDAYGAFEYLRDHPTLGQFWRKSADGHSSSWKLKRVTPSQLAAEIFACRSKSAEFQPELQEGYQYQPNATDTGIVSIDLNGESLDLLTPEFIERAGIVLTITDDE